MPPYLTSADAVDTPLSRAFFAFTWFLFVVFVWTPGWVFLYRRIYFGFVCSCRFLFEYVAVDHESDRPAVEMEEVKTTRQPTQTTSAARTDDGSAHASDQSEGAGGFESESDADPLDPVAVSIATIRRLLWQTAQYCHETERLLAPGILDRISHFLSTVRKQPKVGIVFLVAYLPAIWWWNYYYAPMLIFGGLFPPRPTNAWRWYRYGLAARFYQTSHPLLSAIAGVFAVIYH